MKHNTVDYDLIRKLQAQKLTRSQIMQRTGLCGQTVSFAIRKIRKEIENEIQERSVEVKESGTIHGDCTGEKIGAEDTMSVLRDSH